MIRAKILLLSIFCLFSLCFFTLSVLGEEVTKEKGVIPYKEWKDYTVEEKEKLENRWTEDDKYKNIRKIIIERKTIPKKDALKIKRSDGLNMYDLQGAYLVGADLQRANLSGANLQGADLSLAKLQGAYLARADLQGADLRVADLQGADLSLANLQGADLLLAKLQGADLRGADLKGAELRGVNLRQVNLLGANLFDARLAPNQLWQVNLEGVRNKAYIIWGGDFR